MLAALGVAAAPSYALRLLALGALGVGLATFSAAGTRAVFDALTGVRRGLAMSLRQSGVPVGSAIAAAVLPALAVRFGPTPVFVGDAALLLLAGLPFAGAIRPGTVPGGAVFPFAVAAVMVAGQYVPLTFALPTLHAEFGWRVTVAGIRLVVVEMGVSGAAFCSDGGPTGVEHGLRRFGRRPFWAQEPRPASQCCRAQSACCPWS